LPYPQVGGPKTALGIRPDACLAPYLVAGLAGLPGQGLRPHCRYRKLKRRNRIKKRRNHMSISNSKSTLNENGGKEMSNGNTGNERIWSGLGWGIFFILIGSLIFAGNRCWLSEGKGWLYFIIGLGSICIIGFLARFLSSRSNRWAAYGGLVTGICLVYIGTAFLYGYGDWWPLVFIPVGIGLLVKAVWDHRSESTIR
jgi:hypothetical protein